MLLHRKYHVAIDPATHGVWVHNLQGVIVEVNDAYCRLSGYSREELLGASISKVEARESPEEILFHLRKLVEGRGCDHFESSHRRKNGSLIEVDVIAIYLDVQGGRITVFIREITGRQRTKV